MIVGTVKNWYTARMEKSRPSREISLEYSAIHQTMALIGERWTLCVLSEAFAGVCRFDEMREHLGIASNILSNRLQRLVTHGILEPIPYKEKGRRTRNEYQLTRKGLELLPALVALIQWGDHYMPDAALTSVVMLHAECEQEVHVEIVCANHHRIDNAHHLKRVIDLALPEA